MACNVQPNGVKEMASMWQWPIALKSYLALAENYNEMRL